jgi:hypothetical protein
MANTKKAKSIKEIEFDFIKSNFFRVIHVDGAFGGVAPSGSIHMAVYSERHAIPTKTVHKLDGNQLGEEVVNRRTGRAAIVREVEVDIVMGLDQAIVMRGWLDEKIANLQQLTGADIRNAGEKK